MRNSAALKCAIGNLGAHDARRTSRNCRMPLREISVVTITPDALDREILTALEALSVKDAAAAVAARTGLPRREVYGRTLQLAGERR